MVPAADLIKGGACGGLLCPPGKVHVIHIVVVIQDALKHLQQQPGEELVPKRPLSSSSRQAGLSGLCSQVPLPSR